MLFHANTRELMQVISATCVTGGGALNVVPPYIKQGEHSGVLPPLKAWRVSY